MWQQKLYQVARFYQNFVKKIWTHTDFSSKNSILSIYLFLSVQQLHLQRSLWGIAIWRKKSWTKWDTLSKFRFFCQNFRFFDPGKGDLASLLAPDFTWYYGGTRQFGFENNISLKIYLLWYFPYKENMIIMKIIFVEKPKNRVRDVQMIAHIYNTTGNNRKSVYLYSKA